MMSLSPLKKSSEVIVSSWKRIHIILQPYCLLKRLVPPCGCHLVVLEGLVFLDDLTRYTNLNFQVPGSAIRSGEYVDNKLERDSKLVSTI